MSTKLLLRIASGLMIFHVIGHTLGHIGWKKTTDPVKQEVINQMTGHKFPFMGANIGLGDAFEGYGWALSIAMIFFALTLWFISSSLSDGKAMSQKILVALFFCLLVWSIDEFIFFFPFAACTTLLAAILTLIATVQMKSQKT